MTSARPANDAEPHDDAPGAVAKDAAVRRETAAEIGAEGREISLQSVTIGKPRAELYAFFRDFTNLPHFMENIVRIDVRDAMHSHWVVAAPAGRTVEWDSVITDETPGERFTYTSTGDADIANSGRIEFRDAPGGRGTVVSATLTYDPPGGKVGKLIALLFQKEPSIQSRRDLRRLKQLMETGEIATAARNRAAADADDMKG